MAPKGPIGPRFDLTGQVFGRLTALKPVRLERNGKPALGWKCRCECGATTVILTAILRNGGIRSCGCLRIDEVVETGHRNRTHGESGFTRGVPKSPEYSAWQAMINRCKANEGTKNFKYYTKHGVKVCKRWEKYENFLADMGRRPSTKHSLDRYPDKNGDYKKSNCRWATSSEQSANRRPWKRRTKFN